MNPEPQPPKKRIPLKVWLLALALGTALVVTTLIAYSLAHQAVMEIPKKIKLNIPF